MFDKSAEIDASERDRFVAKIDCNRDYLVLERFMLDRGMKTIDDFLKDPKKKLIKSVSPLAKTYILKAGKGERLITGVSTIEVNSSYKQALAYHWLPVARCRATANNELRILEEPSGHNKVAYTCKDGTSLGILPREGVHRMIFKCDDTSASMVSFPCEHALALPRCDRVVAQWTKLFKIEKLPKGRCKFTYYSKLDLGGSVPSVVMSFNAKMNLTLAVRTQQYFLKLRKLRDLDAKDGLSLGTSFTLQSKAEKKRPQGVSFAEVRVDELFENHLGLKELARLHPSVQGMLTAVVRNKVWKSKGVFTKLDNLSRKEGQHIGGGLALALITNTAPESAVDEWVYRYPALIELDDRFAWFRPMMNVMGKKVFETSNTGAKYRAFSGASLSMMDLASDGYMFWTYFQDGSYGFAKGIIATMATNTLVQLIIVYGQNRKMGKKVLLWECFTTILCVQPAVLAWRVATGAAKDANHLFDTEIEIGCSRIGEIVCKSLPSGIMQTYAFFLAKERSKAAAASLVISAMTTGFVGTVVSWDFDTSPSKRKVAPDFYGYIRNDPTSRTFTFLAMFMVTCSHVLMKTIAASLVMCVNGTWLVIYLGGDVLVFLLLKIIRGDFRYWLNLPNKVSLLASSVTRVLTKVLTDFTLVMQMRHSFEIGGLQFSLLIVQNQAMCLVAGWIYLMYYDGANEGDDDEVGGNGKLEAETLWAGLLGLLGLFLVSVLAFISLMDSNYLHTFFSWTTGPQYAVMQYQGCTTDLQRVAAFDQHPSYYAGVRDAMHELIDENWDVWMKDRPVWLTDNVIASIPDDYLPKLEVKRFEAEGGGKRRRSSAFGGGVRAGAKVQPDERVADIKPKQPPVVRGAAMLGAVRGSTSC